MSYKFTDNEDLQKLIKFAITGGINTGVDFAVFMVLNSFTGAGIYISKIAGYSCGLLNSYIINRSWTFRSKEKFFSKQMIKFLVLGLAMMLLSLGIIHVCSTVVGLSDTVSNIVTTGLVLVVNFTISKLWVFKQ